LRRKPGYTDANQIKSNVSLREQFTIYCQTAIMNSGMSVVINKV